MGKKIDRKKMGKWESLIKIEIEDLNMLNQGFFVQMTLAFRGNLFQVDRCFKNSKLTVIFVIW